MSKRSRILVSLSAFLLFGCDQKKTTHPVLSHPSFDSIEHFSAFLEQIDFASLKGYQSTFKVMDIKDKTESLKYDEINKTNIEQNEADTYSLIHSNGYPTEEHKETFENHHHYSYLNDKKYFELSKVNMNAPNAIPTDFTDGLNQSFTISNDGNKINGSTQYISDITAKEHILSTLKDDTIKQTTIQPISKIFSDDKNIIRYSSTMDGSDYLVTITCHSDENISNQKIEYRFDSSFLPISYSVLFKKRYDFKKDYNRKAHSAINNYRQTERIVSFIFGEKIFVPTPKEKQSILSIFGEDALS